MKLRINPKVGAVGACLLLLITFMQANVASAISRNNIPSPGGYMSATFNPQVVRAGRCGQSNIYLTSSDLARDYGPSYTGAIRWMNWQIRSTSSYLFLRYDYIGLAARKVRTSTGWTVIWQEEATASCDTRRSYYA